MNRQFLAVAVSIVIVTGLVIAASQGSEIVSGSDGNAVLVTLDGTITPTPSGGFSASGITPSGVRDINEKVNKKDPEAVIYEINSGGGAVVASKEIKREIESIKVPTVCRFRDISASGGYLISLGCDKIVADSATLTGSIGVRSGYLEYSGLLKRYGVEYVNISAGEYKTLGSPYINTTKDERKVLSEKVRKIHDEFLSEVEGERNLTERQLREVRTGEPILGDRAKQLGLVDSIGGRQRAISVAENMTGKELSTEVVETGPEFALGSLFGLKSMILGGYDKSPIQARYR